MQLCLHGCLQYQLQQTCRILLCLQHIQNCVRLKTVYKTIHILQGSKLLDKRCLLCVQEYLMVMHEQICIMWQCLSVNLLNWRALMVLLASKRLCSTNFAAWLIWWWSYWESGKLTAFIPCMNILCASISCTCWYKNTIASYMLSTIWKLAANLCEDQWHSSTFERKETEKTRPFGVNLMRRQVLHRAAHICKCSAKSSSQNLIAPPPPSCRTSSWWC